MGTRDSKVRKLDHTYLIYEINRCNNDNRDLTLLDENCEENEV